MNKFYFGLDLGQSQDYTALAVIEAKRKSQLHLRHAKRYELGTPYPDIVTDVAALLKRQEVGSAPELVVDGTGVGAPVVDMFHKAGLLPYVVKIHGGDKVNSDGLEYRIPKRDLASCLQVYLQEKRLKIAAALPLADILIGELLNFKVKISEKGHDSYEAWREGDHDDLVIAVAMPCWFIQNVGSVPVEAFTENTEGWPDWEEEWGD